MKRWIGLAVALYPPSWREEFGHEFRALLDDVRPSWRVFADVLRGAVEMQMTNRGNWLKVVGAMAAVGAIVGGGLSLRVAPIYESTAVISVASQADPLRPESPEMVRQRSAAHFAAMETRLLSRTELSTIINDPRLRLYRAEQRAMPLEDVIAKMRHDIRIEARPSTQGGLAPLVFGVSFSYPDAAKVQATVRELTAKFTEMNLNINQSRTAAYRNFWGDVSALEHTKPAPPPPVGETVAIVNAASLPMESMSSHRSLFLAGGLGLGTLLGLLMALAMRWPRQTRQLAGFAVAGCVLAAAASFLIPNRYVSTATMMIYPAQITEDPLSPLPAATSAAEFLRGIEPEILNFESLSKIIQDPRLRLYQRERATKPMEEVVRNMLAKDLRITPLGSTPGFQITFSYYDRFQGQMGTTAILAAFEKLAQKKARESASQMGFRGRVIYERKAGGVLDVLDNASLPTTPVSPNRWIIAAMGLVAGLLPGGIKLRFGRPGTGSLIRVQASKIDLPKGSDQLPPSSNPMLVCAPDFR